METTLAEEIFLKFVRNFSFLESYGYCGKSFRIGGKEPGVVYENIIADRVIYIYYAENGKLTITVERKKKSLFNRKNMGFTISPMIYESFGCGYLKNIECKHEIKENALFIKKYLLPVIKGEMWIDELLKKKNIL